MVRQGPTGGGHAGCLRTGPSGTGNHRLRSDHERPVEQADALVFTKVSTNHGVFMGLRASDGITKPGCDDVYREMSPKG